MSEELDLRQASKHNHKKIVDIGVKMSEETATKRL